MHKSTINNNVPIPQLSHSLPGASINPSQSLPPVVTTSIIANIPSEAESHPVINNGPPSALTLDSISPVNSLFPQQPSSSSMTPILTTPKKKRNRNLCVTFIKEELSRLFTLEELATQRCNAAKRKFKEDINDMNQLSPRRINSILVNAKKKFRDDFKSIPKVNEIINSKCRKAKQKFNKINI